MLSLTILLMILAFLAGIADKIDSKKSFKGIKYKYISTLIIFLCLVGSVISAVIDHNNDEEKTRVYEYNNDPINGSHIILDYTTKEELQPKILMEQFGSLFKNNPNYVIRDNRTYVKGELMRTYGVYQAHLFFLDEDADTANICKFIEKKLDSVNQILFDPNAIEPPYQVILHANYIHYNQSKVVIDSFKPTGKQVFHVIADMTKQNLSSFQKLEKTYCIIFLETNINKIQLSHLNMANEKISKTFSSSTFREFYFRISKNTPTYYVSAFILKVPDVHYH